MQNIIRLKHTALVENAMKEFTSLLMVTIDPKAQILNHLGIGIDRINLKTPTYRKFVKRREKIETTKYQKTSIQVNYPICYHTCIVNY